MALLAILVAIAVFLILRSLPAFHHNKSHFLTETEWDRDNTHVFGIAALAFGTILSSLVALVMAVPIAIGVAVFIHGICPPPSVTCAGLHHRHAGRRTERYLRPVGVFLPRSAPRPRRSSLNAAFGWIPLFAGNPNQVHQPGTMFMTSVVLAIMILPIVAAITPRGAPAGRPSTRKQRWLWCNQVRNDPHGGAAAEPVGIVGATMLGLGRALGETIAVALVLGTSYVVNPHILQPGGNTIAANIALTLRRGRQCGPTCADC